MDITRQFDNRYFPYPLVVEFLDGHMWRLTEKFEYHRDCGEIITVPKNFRFDFASIPQIFWSWIGSPTGEYGPAALVHDYLCENNNYTKKRADYVFHEAMIVLKVPFWKRMIMYWAVRMYHWLKQTNFLRIK